MIEVDQDQPGAPRHPRPQPIEAGAVQRAGQRILGGEAQQRALGPLGRDQRRQVAAHRPAGGQCHRHPDIVDEIEVRIHAERERRRQAAAAEADHGGQDEGAAKHPGGAQAFVPGQTHGRHSGPDVHDHHRIINIGDALQAMRGIVRQQGHQRDGQQRCNQPRPLGLRPASSRTPCVTSTAPHSDRMAPAETRKARSRAGRVKTAMPIPSMT